MRLARAFCLLFTAIFFYCPVAQGARCESKPIRQVAQRFPVVFRPDISMIGARVKRLQAWRYHEKKWQRVLLQVDEVDDDGSYVLEEGLPYTRYNDDGVLDSNDELSMAADSVGPAFSRKIISKKLLKSFNRWARVDFCGDSGTYLGSVLIGETRESSEPLKFKALFNQATGEVETKTYHYWFRKDQPMLIGDVKLKTPFGDKEVFSGSSFVMPLIPKFFLFPSFYFGQDDFQSAIESWRSGPVRSIVAVGAKMRKFFSIFDLHLFSELVFYEDFFQIPTKIQFIFDPSRYLSRGSGLAYTLTYPEGVDWVLHSNLEPLPVKGPDHPTGAKTAYEASKEGAFAVRGTSSMGSFLAHVRVDEKALRQAPPPYLASKEVFTRDDYKRAWPWLAQSAASLGVFIEISGVKAGSYDFALDVALSNQADDVFADFQTVLATWPDSTKY